jgi:hypothetical protein
MKHALLFFVALSTSFVANAASSNHEISGFRYQTCSAQSCVEVSSPKAWLSQLNYSFSTESDTTVRILSVDGVELKKLSGTSAMMHPILKSVVLDRADGTSAIVSLDDGSISEVGR